MQRRRSEKETKHHEHLGSYQHQGWRHDKGYGLLSSGADALGIEQKFLIERLGGHTAGYGREKVQLFIGNGADPAEGSVHLAFEARSRGEVDAFHAAALAAGGRDNGQPGVRARYHAGYYATFVIDPAGNNVEAVYQGVR